LILQIVPVDVSAERAEWIVALADRAAGRGYRCYWVAEQPPPVLRRLARLEHLPLEGAGGTITAWRRRRRLTQLIGEHRPVLLHVYDLDGLELALRIGPGAGPALLLSLPDDVALDAGQRRLLERWPRAQLCALAGSDAAIARIGERTGLAAARCRVVPPGIALDQFEAAGLSGAQVAATAERWAIDPAFRMVFVPGPCVPAHGHLDLLAAAARSARDDLMLVFGCHVAGTDRYARTLERQAGSLGLGDRLRFVDDRDELGHLLQLADVVMLPAIEPLDFVPAVAAAQAIGRLVVVRDLGGLAGQVDPGTTGWVLAAADQDQLAWALDAALRLDRPLLDQLAPRARAFAAAHFDRARTLDAIVEIYREFAPSPQRPHAGPELTGLAARDSLRAR
jgi:glycosyltransferase involved in cell wall biosynthesis